MNYTCFYYIEKQLFSFSIKILESEKIYLDNQCGILGKGKIWNLPEPGMERVVPCIGRRILNHWNQGSPQVIF